MENANSYEYLDKIKIAVIENLKKTAPVPSVQMQDVPRQGLGMTDEEEAELDDLDDDENKDVRMTQRQWEKSIVRQDEFDESDDEEMAQANGLNYDGPARRSIMDYKNPHADYDIDSGAVSPSGRATPVQDDANSAKTSDPKEVTMTDADAAVPAEGEAPQKAAEAAEAAKVDDDGDVDMDDSTAKSAEDAKVKTEDAENNASPATAGGDPTEAAKPSEGTPAPSNKENGEPDKPKSPVVEQAKSTDGAEEIAAKDAPAASRIEAES